MNLKLHDNFRPGLRRSVRAFTMIEIALALAVIGFALVAIIGILPAGLTVQKQNREQTIINFDASFLMDALRSGARGQDSLTNYIIAITNVSVECNSDGFPNINTLKTNWFTLTDSSTNGTQLGYSLLTSGSNIVGLLSVPKYVTNSSGFISNTVIADFRAISGPALDHGASLTSRDFSFTYRVVVELMPSADHGFTASDNNEVNVTAPGTLVPLVGITDTNLLNQIEDEWDFAENLQNNLMEIRLRFRWPILANGGTAPGNRAVYRTAAAGTITNMATFPEGVPLNFIQPQVYR